MTSREVTRFYLVTKSTLYDFKRVTRFYLVRKSTLISTEVTWFYINEVNSL